MQIEYPETSLPVLRETDVVAVGGSMAGIAAALCLSKGSQSVVLVEPRTYPGRDITATLRPWLTLPERATLGSLPQPVRIILDAHSLELQQRRGEIPLRPDTIKLGPEDALLEAKVDLLYASLPVGMHETDDSRASLIIGNKSGRQVIRCRTIIDATETALVARLTDGAFEQLDGETPRFSRTLEFDRAGPLKESTLAVPDRLQIAGNVVRLHPGHRGPAHILVECDLDLPYSAGLKGSADVESEARRRTMRLAAWLIHQHPELAEARYAGSSHELHGRWTSSLAGPPPEWSEHAAGTVVHATGDDGCAFNAPLPDFAGPASNLWCLSEAGRLDAEQTAWFLDPVRAGRLGESFAYSLLAASPALASREVTA